MTAPASPWITIYFVPPRYNPVGASDPGSAKSFITPVISSGLHYINQQGHKRKKNAWSNQKRSTNIQGIKGCDCDEENMCVQGNNNYNNKVSIPIITVNASNLVSKLYNWIKFSFKPVIWKFKLSSICAFSYMTYLTLTVM